MCVCVCVCTAPRVLAFLRFIFPLLCFCFFIYFLFTFLKLLYLEKFYIAQGKSHLSYIVNCIIKNYKLQYFLQYFSFYQLHASLLTSTSPNSGISDFRETKARIDASPSLVAPRVSKNTTLERAEPKPKPPHDARAKASHTDIPINTTRSQPVVILITA